MKNFRIVTEGQSENNFVNRTDVQESKEILFQIQEMLKMIRDGTARRI